MKAWVFWIGLICFGTGSMPAPLWAQDGAVLFRTWCASCHEAGGESRAPRREALKLLSPEQILAALESGVMSAQGRERGRAERVALAEYITEKKIGDAAANPIPRSAYCSKPPDAIRNSSGEPAWNGWGATVRNLRFQPGATAGISSEDVPRLKLKWAFGFPGAVSASAQPAIWGGRVFVGSWPGDIYSLDAKTGCIYWAFQAEASVWAAVSLGKAKGGGLAAYVGDAAANVYALDATSGKLLWKAKVDEHPLARVTGSPTLYGGRLYVPVASREESWAVDPKYECCTFQGSLVALDAATGQRFWKTRLIAEEPRRTQKSRIGTQLWGPAGVGVWSAPTIDEKRKLIYVGTGNSYSFPQANTSDAIVAFDMKSGKIRWVRQLTEVDVSVSGCRSDNPDPAVCSGDAPDFDFGSSPILVERKGGGRLLLAGQKAAMVYALDPERDGKLVWQQRVGKGSSLGGIVWGPAADGEKIYAALSDPERFRDGSINPNSGGGMVALAIDSGQKIWNTPAPSCGAKTPCGQAQTAAVTVIPGAVFSGSIDGHLRAYSTGDGKIIWDYDTAREFATVNGVRASGGSMSGGGSAVAGGMVFINSGFIRSNGVMPGNVLLAFSVE
jgi:polyvinyl alcohol dehydrogenase (cytochrome)